MDQVLTGDIRAFCGLLNIDLFAENSPVHFGELLFNEFMVGRILITIKLCSLIFLLVNK